MATALSIISYIIAGMFFWPICRGKPSLWLPYSVMFLPHRIAHSFLAGHDGCLTIVVILASLFFGLRYFGIDPWSLDLDDLGVGWFGFGCLILVSALAYRCGDFLRNRRPKRKATPPIAQPLVEPAPRIIYLDRPQPANPLAVEAERLRATHEVIDSLPVGAEERQALHEEAERAFYLKFAKVLRGD
jgi:hypothetical protein